MRVSQLFKMFVFLRFPKRYVKNNIKIIIWMKINSQTFYRFLSVHSQTSVVFQKGLLLQNVAMCNFMLPLTVIKLFLCLDVIRALILKHVLESHCFVLLWYFPNPLLLMETLPTFIINSRLNLDTFFSLLNIFPDFPHKN